MTGPKLLGAAFYRSFRCLWMLEELQIPYRYKPLHPQSDEVLKLNPLGKVPILVEEDGGFSLFESGAINTYLGDKYRARNSTLVPVPGTRERGLYEQTLSVLATEMDAQGLWIQRKHETLGEFYTFVPDAVKHARKYFHKTNRCIIGQLKKNGGPYLLGRNFTAADIYYVHCLDWSQEIGWDDKWRSEIAVVEYLDLCHSRPAYIKVNQMKNDQRKEAATKASIAKTRKSKL